MPVKEDNEVYQESDYNPAEQLRKEEEAALLNTEQQLNDDKSPEGMALKEAADNHAASANKKVVHRTSRKEQGGQWQKSQTPRTSTTHQSNLLENLPLRSENDGVFLDLSAHSDLVVDSLSRSSAQPVCLLICHKISVFKMIDHRPCLSDES